MARKKRKKSEPQAITGLKYFDKLAPLCEEVDGWRWSSLSAYGKGGTPAAGSPAWLEIGPAPRGRK